MEIMDSISPFRFGGFHSAFKLCNHCSTRIPIGFLEDRVPLVISFKPGDVTAQLEEINSHLILIDTIFLNGLVI